MRSVAVNVTAGVQVQPQRQPHLCFLYASDVFSFAAHTLYYFSPYSPCFLFFSSASHTCAPSMLPSGASHSHFRDRSASFHMLTSHSCSVTSQQEGIAGNGSRRR